MMPAQNSHRSFRSLPLFSLAIALLAVHSPPPAAAQEEARADAARHFPLDTTVVSERQVVIRGETVPYTATLGMQPVWDDEGEPIASLFYTYYERADVSDRTRRPLVISFNGGPGSASVWMHIGYTGPRFLQIDPEGFPVQPYGTQDNHQSLLDVADIVYVNPVNTGFSRMLPDADRSRFFGVNEDISYLADWIDTFISRRARWSSPKFLIGESYGTTRVAGLAGELQGRHWMFLNGVVLVSPTDLGIEREGPVGAALLLPHYTATAWYHDALPAELQGRDLENILPEVERFTVEEYIPALSGGGFLDDARRREIAEQVAYYSGLSMEAVLNHNLAVPVNFFRKELLRDRGLTVGRLDARYLGRDREDAGTSYDYDPALTAWNHAFAPAINHYLRDELGWQTDLQYWLFGPVHPWNRSGDRTGENLRQAMAQNPFLNVMIQSGYYDGGTDYFSAKYTMWNLDPSGRLRDRLRYETYRSGHMMYLREPDLAAANQDIRDFIRASIPAEGAPAMYGPGR